MRKRSEVEIGAADHVLKTLEAEKAREVSEKSAELRDRLAEAEDVSDPDFTGGKIRDIHPAFQRTVLRVFVKEEEFDSSYDKLVELLRALEGRTERQFWKEHLTKAAEGHHLATRLYATAQRILSNWEADNDKVTAAMRERAYRELQDEKEQGKRNKTITDKDVDDRATIIYPREFRGYGAQRKEYGLMVENLGSIVKSFDHLNGALRSLVGST
jgi:hypothetical protein